MPVHVKIRIAVALGLTTLAFAFLGYPAISPEIPGDQLKWFPDFHAIYFLVAVCLCLVAPITGFFAGKERWRAVGTASVPFGLAVWAIQSGGMNKSLVGVTDIVQRKFVFMSMIEEMIVWTALVWLGYFSAKVIYRQAWPSPKSYNSSANIRKKINQVWINNAGGVLIVLMGGGLLLYGFLQSGQAILGTSGHIGGVPIPSKGQIIFAVMSAFFLSALAAHQLLGSALWSMLVVPSLLATVVYLNASREDLLSMMQGMGTHFVHIDARLAVVTPLVYISVGSLGVIAGYFLSVRTGRLRNLFV